MNDRDTVKLSIYCKTGGTSIMITSRENAEQFREDVITNAIISGWYEVEGRLDHINGNSVKTTLNYEDIAGFDILEVNQI